MLAVLPTLTGFAQERGALIFRDNFDTPLTLAENWLIPKGHGHLFKSFDGEVWGSSGIIMRRQTPDDFWAELDLTFDSPKDPNGNSRAGFTVGKHYFLLSPQGRHFMWRGKSIEGFEIGKPTRITLIRKCSKTTALYVFKANGKELQRASFPLDADKKTPLQTFCYGTTIRIDNFKLYALKEGESSRNSIPNGGFEYEQEGFPLSVCRGESYLFANYQTIPYEDYLKTWSLDSTEKHSGQYSLKLVNDESCNGHSLWMHGADSEKDKVGVLSVWLKADQEDFPVNIGYGNRKEVKVGMEWKRYEVVNTNLPKPGVYSPVTLFFREKKGTLWVDDMQAEFLDGVTQEELKIDKTFATPYKPSPLGKRLLPVQKTYERPKSIKIPRLPAGVKPSDGLDAWKKRAVKLKQFYYRGEKPKNKTEVFLACDPTNLYIGYRCRVKDVSTVEIKTCNRDSYELFSNGGIEFFLDPEADGAFYQFAANNGNSLFDLGKGDDTAWNGNWKSAAQINRDESSVDYVVTIPFATLANPRLQKRWLMNFCRNDREAAENLTIFKTTNPETKNTRIWPYAELPATIVRKYALGANSGSYSEDKSGIYISFDLDNSSGQKRNILAEVIDLQNDGKIIASRQFAFATGKSLLSLPAKGKSEKVLLRLSEAGKIIVEQILSLEKQPCVSMLGRLSYYMNEKEAQFRISTLLPNPETLTATLNCGGKTVRHKGATVFKMSLSLKNIGAGTHAVTLTLEKGGKEVASAKSELIKRPFKAGATQINHFSRSLLVDGKPYIPISPFFTTYNGNHPYARKDFVENRVAFFSHYGFKTIDTLTWERDGDFNGIPIFLRAVEALNLKVMMWMGYMGADGFMSDEQIDRQLQAAASPNIITQRVMDEPEIGGITSEKARELLLKMRPRFPYQPTYMNNTCIFVGGNYANRETDILMIDDYLTNQHNRSVYSVIALADGMWKMGIKKGKPVFFFLVGGNFPLHYREPSYAEQIAQTYGSITAGCTGITYFYGHFTTTGNWKAVLQLNQELLNLTDVICSDEETGQSAATGDAKLMRHLTKKHDGYLYIISCNIDENPAGKVEFTLPAEYKYAREAEVMFENRKLKVKDGKFTDEFPTHTRHVYKIKIQN